jgi:hypothetical protein
MEIEVDSLFRNRTIYPNPFNFNVSVNCRNYDSYDDFTSKSAPQRFFRGNTLDFVIANVTSLNGTILRILPDAVEVSFPLNTLFSLTDYYRGLLSDGNNLVQKYENLSPTVGRFFLQSIDSSLLVGGLFNLYYWPQTQSLATLDSLVKIFIPAKPRNNQVDILYNESKNNYNVITSSDEYSVTVLIKNTNWSYSDSFSLRDEPPAWFGTCVFSTLDLVTLSSDEESQKDIIFVPFINFFGKIVEKIGPVVKISPLLPFALAPGTSVQCLHYSYQNNIPLIYLGTADQQQKTWLMSLVNVQIPKFAALKNKKSILDFSHLYVEFRDPQQTNQNNIISNNPNSKFAFFRIIPSKIQGNREWISFDCDNSSKTVRFSPSASQYSFKITSPDGKVLEFLAKDSIWPKKPLSELQVSALFNVKLV